MAGVGGGGRTRLPGVEAREEMREGIPVTRVSILDRRGEEALGKPVGTYVTLTLDGLARREENAFGRAARAVAAELGELLELPSSRGPGAGGGAGQPSHHPGRCGPQGPRVHPGDPAPGTAGAGALRGPADQWHPCLPAVLGTTGMESGELVRAVSERLRPACVIAVDALASRSLKRVCRTVQLADTGIAPGSGVGNHRAALDRASLGVPVIAVGVPTVVDGATLAADLLGTEELPPLGEGRDLMVTPKDIDSQVADLSKVIGYGIDLALQPSLTLEDLDLLLS